MSTLRPATLVSLLCALVPACGRSDETETVGRATTDASAAHSSEPLLFAGQIELVGALAGVKRGCVFVDLWRRADLDHAGAQPRLSRKYEIGDPDWSQRPGSLSRWFGLTEDDLVGEVQPALGDELELEARYDPDGVAATSEGVVRARARVRNGDKDIALVVNAAAKTKPLDDAPADR